MKLTKNFSKQEFDSKDGAVMPPQILANISHLAKQLQVLRDELGLNIRINSGYRSKSHNKAVGGSPNSRHLLGKAADIVVSEMRPLAVYNLIEKLIEQSKMKQGGIGIYDNFVHYDTRGTKARWDFRKKK